MEPSDALAPSHSRRSSQPLVVLAGPALAQQGSAFTVQDLVSLYRLSDPQISPDGRQVAYVLRETDLEANKGRTDLWLIDLAA